MRSTAPNRATAPVMKNGILRPEEGFDILVDGKHRTFVDREHVAYEVARNLKERHRGSVVTVFSREKLTTLVMLEDGRTA
jgi:hypothetical protein